MSPFESVIVPADNIEFRYKMINLKIVLKD